jgi:hypothetical protein
MLGMQVNSCTMFGWPTLVITAISTASCSWVLFGASPITCGGVHGRAGQGAG